MAPKASPPPAGTANERVQGCCDPAPRNDADFRPARTEDCQRAADTGGRAAAEPSNNDPAPRTDAAPPGEQVQPAPDGGSADRAASGTPGQIIAQGNADQSSAPSAVPPTLGIVPPILASAAANGLRIAPGPTLGQGRFQANPEAIGAVSAAAWPAPFAGADAAPAGSAIASDALMAASGITVTDAGITPLAQPGGPDQPALVAGTTQADMPAGRSSALSIDGTAAKPPHTPASDAVATAQAALTEDPAAAQATGSSPGTGATEAPSSVREAALATRAVPQRDADPQSAQSDGTAMMARASEPVPAVSPQGPAIAQAATMPGADRAGPSRLADPAPRAIATIDQVAVHIRHAAAAGIDKIRIQLWPEELGPVDIRLEVHESGSVKATILSDRPETLDLLQRDSRSLDRALQDAGLKTDGNSLHFASHDRSDRGQHRDPDSSGSGQAQAMADSPPGEAADDPAPIVLRLNRNSLLDIQV